MTKRNHDGARLAAWRESLPGAKPGVPIRMRSLSAELGWGLSRWRDLEQLETWSPHQRDEVGDGVRAIASRMELAPEAVERCVAHVLDGARAPELSAWREGQCPAARMGRPRGTGRPLRRSPGRVVALPGEAPDPARPQAARPILPDNVRQNQADLIWRMLENGEIDFATARRALDDLNEPLHAFYNKPSRSVTSVA